MKTLKRIYSFILIALCLILATSCDLIKGGFSQKEGLRDFFDAKKYDIKIEKLENGIKEYVGTIKNNDSYFEFTTSENLDQCNGINLLVTKDDCFYLNRGQKSLYANWEETEEMSLDNFRNIDMYEYCSDFSEKDEYLEFKLNFHAVLNYLKTGEGNSDNGPKYDAKCYFSDEKVNKLEIIELNLILIFNVNSYDENVDIASPVTSEYERVAIDELFTCIFDSTNSNVNPDEYTYYVADFDIAVDIKEEVSYNFESYIYSKTDYNAEAISIPISKVEVNQIYFEEEGEYEVNARTYYNGYYFYATFNVKAYDFVEKDKHEKLDFIESVEYSFIEGDYMYLCDDTAIYQYDLTTETYLGYIELGCSANSHYVRDGYLYVAANYPASSHMPASYYRGTITKIKLSDFTVEKQVNVNCYPYSIIVDMRGTVIVSKGYDQHIYIDAVNMEDGSLTNLFMGYQHDLLIYDEVNDAIIVDEQDSTADTVIYQYNSLTSRYEKTQKDCIIDCENFIKKDGTTIIEEGKVYKYDEELNEYVSFQINIDSEYETSIDVSDVEGDYTYSACSLLSNYILAVINYQTGDSEYYYVEFGELNIQMNNIFYYDNKVYMISNSSVLMIINLE